MHGILLDADVPPAVAAALAKLGHDAVAASGNPDLEELPDLELLREATRQRRVLVTFNVADFSEAAKLQAHREENHAGIILIRARSYPRTQIGAIANAIAAVVESRRDFQNSVLYLN